MLPSVVNTIHSSSNEVYRSAHRKDGKFNPLFSIRFLCEEYLYLVHNSDFVISNLIPMFITMDPEIFFCSVKNKLC